MSKKHGGHRHGKSYNLPDWTKSAVKVPRALIVDVQDAAYQIFIAWLKENYGVASIDDLDDQTKDEVYKLMAEK